MKVYSLVIMACTLGIAAAEAAPPLNPESIATGKKVYEQSCAGCHGANGYGCVRPGSPRQTETR